MDKNVKITVFTPTYNRAYLLKQLYSSLVEQNHIEFEWLLVDDGSTDQTKELIDSFISENKININYIYQKNQGKHIAINTGLDHARGELFFMIDSDDFAAPDALNTIWKRWENVRHDDSYGGIIGQKNYTNGEPVGSPIDYDVHDWKYVQYQYKGDKALIFKTSVFLKYKFPHFPSERFCDEALIWNRISGPYTLRFVNDVLMIGDYIKDGLTQKMISLRYNNHQATMLYFKEAANNKEMPFINRFKALNNYWRFSKNANLSFFEKWRYSNMGKMNLISFPTSYFKRYKDKRKSK